MFHRHQTPSQSTRPYGYCTGPARSNWSNPVGPHGHCPVGLHRFQALLHAGAVQSQIAALARARTGFDRACPECLVKSRTGPITWFDRAGHLTLLWINHGQSCTVPVQSHSNPGARPVKSRDRPRTGLDRALWQRWKLVRSRYNLAVVLRATWLEN